jgi:hypothetical protein
MDLALAPNSREVRYFVVSWQRMNTASLGERLGKGA